MSLEGRKLTLEARKLREGESDRLREFNYAEQNHTQDFGNSDFQIEMGYTISMGKLMAIRDVISKDSQHLIFTDNSEIMKELNDLITRCETLHNADKSDFITSQKIKQGFDELGNQLTQMYNKVNNVYNEFGKQYYPDGNSIVQENGISK